MTVGKVQLAALARQVAPELTSEQSMAIAELQHKAILKAESHDLRFARFMRRQLGKQLGAAGATIHQLRAELALVRQQKAAMVHSAIDELIKGAVIEAVPLTFGADGVIRGMASEEEPIGSALLGETAPAES